MRACRNRDRSGWFLMSLAAMMWVRAGTLLAAVPAGSDAGVPLPPGIPALREPATVQVGTATLQVFSFMSGSDTHDLVAFYQETLPYVGWHLEQLPWQNEQARLTARLEKTLKERRRAGEESKETNATLTEFKQTQQAMQQQIYASRGSEHVIVNLWPLGEDQGTAVFINRWSGDRTWLEDSAPSSGDGSAWAGQGWTPTNACCSGQAVPGVNVLPFLIPWYPGAKAVARSTSPAGGTMVLLMTPDAAETIAVFYRAQMPSSGWKLLGEESAAGDEHGGPGHRLSFQKPDRACSLTIQPGATAEDGTTAQTMITVMASVRASDGKGP